MKWDGCEGGSKRKREGEREVEVKVEVEVMVEVGGKLEVGVDVK